MDKELSDALRFLLRASVREQAEDIIADCQRRRGKQESRVVIITRMKKWFPVAVARWHTTASGRSASMEDTEFVVGLVQEILDELIQQEGN